MALPSVVLAGGPVACAGARVALERDGLDVVGEATDAELAAALCAELVPDACVISVDVAGGAARAANLVARAAPASVLVLLGSLGERGSFLSTVRTGVVAWVPEEAGPDELATAVRGAIAGIPSVPRRETAWLLDEVAEGRAQRAAGLASAPLSPRERDVLDGLAGGLSTAQIAGRLGLSPVTVRRHVSRLRAKLGGRDPRVVAVPAPPGGGAFNG